MAGIWLGIASRREIPATGERGDRLALTSIAIGVITLLFAVAYWAFIAMHVGGGGYDGGGGSGSGGY